MSSNLQNFQVGQSTLVIAVNLDEKERMRLESMGIMPGVEIKILAKGIGPLIVAVGEARIMVEQNIAEGVIVV